MKIRLTLRRLASLGCLTLAGCGGGGGNMMQMKPPPVVPHNFRQLQANVLQTGCAAFSVCHSTRGAAAANHLDLSVDAYTALVGAPSENARAKKEGMLRVKPHDPDASLFIVKLE